MPGLQALSGCFEDAPRATSIGAFEFLRCPRTAVEERELRVLGMVGEGYLEALQPRERRFLPAKLHAALVFTASLAAPVEVESE